MSGLITEFGRRNRSAIIARAQELLREMEWDAAMAKAHREASAELRERFNRVTTVPADGNSKLRERVHA